MRVCVYSYDVTRPHRRSSFSRVRSKVIVRPSAVFELGIHHISRPLYSLPAARAALQHAGLVAPVEVKTQPLYHVYRRKHRPT